MAKPIQKQQSSAEILKMPHHSNGRRLERSRFEFEHPWFDDEQRPTWEKHAGPLQGEKLNILEVGCFEGCATTWILDNLMNHPESRLTVIDTFEGGMEHQEGSMYDMPSIERRFLSNTSKCDHANKLRIIKSKSDDALLDLRRERTCFDLVYIDASHVAMDVLHDAVVCWRLLSVHGLMVFDDVSWKGYLEDCYNPRVAIESFVACVKQEIQVVENGMQLWLRKTENCIPATANPDSGLVYPEMGVRNLE
ncbi:MAG: hypothetical protein Q9167_001823 [Letrouitia subvulpina]